MRLKLLPVIALGLLLLGLWGGVSVAQPLAGVYRVGQGGDYTTLTAALAALKTRGLNAPVTLRLIQPEYTTATGEVFPLTLGVLNGSSAANTVTITTTTTTRISGAAPDAGIFTFSGTDNVVIDGLVGTARGITIENTAGSAAFDGSAAVLIRANGTNDGSRNIQIRNCRLLTAENQSSRVGFGIFIAGSEANPFIGYWAKGENAGADCQAITIENCLIQRCHFGVYIHGDAANPFRNIAVRNCELGEDADLALSLSQGGIAARNVQGLSIENSRLTNIGGKDSPHPYSLIGIELYAVNQANINANRIFGVKYTGGAGWGAAGIAAVEGCQNITITNNAITGITTDGYSDAFNGIAGVLLANVASATCAFNTIYLNESRFVGGFEEPAASACLQFDAQCTNLTIINNVLLNSTGGAGVNIGANYCLLGQGVTGAANRSVLARCDYNLYYATPRAGSPAFTVRIAGQNATPLAAVQTATGGDGSSLRADVSTALASDLSPLPTRSLTWLLNGTGVQFAAINSDIDGATRPTIVSQGAPDIGAFQFEPTTTPPPAVITGGASVGSTQDITVGERRIASLRWLSGSLPTGLTARYYSGRNPADPTNGGRIPRAGWFNAYIDLQAVGGSNYRYQISYYYDPALLGTVSQASSIKMAKRDRTTAGSWNVLTAAVNEAERNFSVSGLNSFSEFTGTDADTTAVGIVGLDSVLCVNAPPVQLRGKPAGGTFRGNGVSGSVLNPSQAGVGQHAVIYEVLTPTGSLRDTVMVDVRPLPTVSLVSKTDTVCPATSVALVLRLSGRAPWKIVYSEEGGVVDSIQNVFTPDYTLRFVPVGSGNRTINFAITDSLGCRNETALTTTVHVLQPPTATIAGISPAVCPGDSARFTVRLRGTPPWAIRYTDSGLPAVSITGITNATYTLTVVATESGERFITLTDVTDGSVCNQAGRVSGVVQLTVHPAPVAVMLASPTNVCKGSEAVFVIRTGGLMPARIAYTTALSNRVDTVTATNDPYTLVYTPQSEGADTLKILSIQDARSCRSTPNTAVPYNVYAIASAQLIGLSREICPGDSVRLRVRFTGEPPFVLAYTENGVPTTLPRFTEKDALFSVAPTTVGERVFSLAQVEDRNRCAGASVSGSVTLTVNPRPTVAITATDTVCVGDTAVFRLRFTGRPPFNYAYTLFNSTRVNAQALDTLAVLRLPADSAGDFRFQLTNLIDGTRCAAVANPEPVRLTVRPRPGARFTLKADSVCTNVPVSFTVAFTGRPPFRLQYLSQQPNTTQTDTTVVVYDSAEGTINLSANQSGLASLRLLSVAEVGGCRAQIADTALLFAYPAPVATLRKISTDTLCAGDSISFAVQFNTGTPPYRLTYTEVGFAPVTVTLRGAEDTLRIAPRSIGAMQLIGIELRDSNQCPLGEVNGEIRHFIVPTPRVSWITTSLDICTGESAIIRYRVTGSMPVTLRYTIDAGAPQTITHSAEGEYDFRLTPQDTTRYTFTQISNRFCSRTVNATAQINVRKSAQAELSGTDTICQGDPDTLTVRFRGAPPFNFTLVGQGGSIRSFSGIQDSVFRIVEMPRQTTEYRIEAVNNLCGPGVATGTATLTVNPRPFANLRALDRLKFCPGGATRLVVIPDTAFRSIAYQWLQDTTPMQGQTRDTLRATSAGNYRVVFTSAAGCTDTSRAIKVEELPKPSAQFTAKPINLPEPDSDVEFTFEKQNNILGVLWDYGDGNISTVDTNKHTYMRAGRYVVRRIVTNNDGCADTFQLADTITVKSDDPIDMPDAFSPNNNDRDDEFKIHLTQGVRLRFFYIQIFNRYEQLVFESYDINNSWNGKEFNNGKSVPEGVYIYRVEYETRSGMRKVLGGTITLMR